jgi:hypothetical protein
MTRSSSRSDFEANPCLIFSDIYIYVVVALISILEGKLRQNYYIYAYGWKSNEKYMHICRGVLAIFLFGKHSLYLFIEFIWEK